MLFALCHVCEIEILFFFNFNKSYQKENVIVL